MWMQWKPSLVIGRVGGSEMIEQQEWIEIVQRRGANASPEPHTGPFDHRLRLDYSFYCSLLWLHNLPRVPGEIISDGYYVPSFRCTRTSACSNAFRSKLDFINQRLPMSVKGNGD